MGVIRNKFHAVLVGVILFFVAANIIWITKDQAPPMWDQSGYLEGSEILYHTLTEKGVGPFIEAFADIIKIKAPLITVLPIPFYILLGNAYASALYVNVFFIILGGFYLYKLGTLMFGEKEALLSVLAVNTFPLVLGLSREFLVEYGLMVLVIMWMYYLLKADSFENRKHVCILGTILGFGMLMKISFLLYITGPTIFVISKKIVQSRKISRASLKNIFLLLLIGAAISGMWYFKNFPSVVDFALKSGFADTAKNYGMGEVFSLKTVLVYWTYLINYGISVYYFFLAIVLSLAVVLSKGLSTTGRVNKTHVVFLVVWLIFPLIILTFGVNKDYRYTAALCPAVAILISAAMIKVLWKGYRKVFLFLILCFPIFNYLYISFSSGPLSIQTKEFKILENHLGYAHPPIKEEWPNERIVKFIYKDKMKMNMGPTKTSVLFNHLYMNQSTFNYYSKKNNMGVSFNTIDFLRRGTIDEIAAQIEEDSDYIVTKSDKLGPDFTNVKNIPLADRLDKGKLHFQKVTELSLPDETVLAIYRRNRDASIYSNIDKLMENYQIDTGKSLNFSDKMRLISYNLRKIKEGYRLIFFWECLTPMDYNYRIFVHIRDNDDRPIANADHYPNKKHPTSEWWKGEVMVDEITITTPLPKKFRVYIGIYEDLTGSRLPLKDKSKDSIYGIQVY